MMAQRIWLFLVIVLLGAGTVWGDITPEKKLVGSPAPDFTLKNLDQQEISLKDYRGKVVLINFWGTWCRPCWKENQALLQIREKYRQKGFEVLSIVLLSPEPSVRYTQQTLKLTYPILWATDEVLKAYGVTKQVYVPRTLLVDEKGIVREDVFGAHDFNFFDELVRKYLKAAPQK